ncbi:hypothetical protein [Xanthomonas oryzae]|uniref:hypothetical protein n=1 Tax=Xanthomonas oryzae TaxID=347 RepID=UPI0012B00BA1|nr:hypothetical protein [Xanthomonas oryzae]QUW77721.1 hypothetical protein KCI36_23190 [Xanthomonas oryzae]UXV84809.1 hypothetical protein IXO35_023390 [Xanthomonas oryzae pv. oryzae]UXV96026.1 hypothetical protein IXO74_023490 [Xanthomonas oryzae pv. oryzae]WJS66048.1 hypothetical protein DXO206_023400 [Xanthomonas oryzae pv. oryzae]WJS69801.1 hypothetical protein DXO091_023155 [Xanthomonas oryzae pv. oryzae]
MTKKMAGAVRAREQPGLAKVAAPVKPENFVMTKKRRPSPPLPAPLRALLA